MPRTPQRTFRQSFIVTAGDTVTGESGVGLTLTGGPTDVDGNGPPASLQGGTATGSGAAGAAALIGGDAASGVPGNVTLTPGVNTGGTLGVVALSRSGIQMVERSSVPGPAMGAGQGRLWVRNDAVTSLVFTDDSGANTTLGINAPERGYFSVLTYGASMDPVVSSRQAFQDACDACQAAGGGVVVVPPVLEPSTQAYLVDGTVTIGANVTVAGLGPRSIIHGRPASGEATFQFAPGLNRSGLRDLQILGDDVTPTGIGVSFTGSQYNIVEHVQIWDFEIGVDVSDGVTPFSAYNVLFTAEVNRSTVIGIRVHQHANGVEIIGGRVFYTFDGSNGGVALSLDNARAVSVNGLSIEAYDVGLRIGGASSGSVSGTWMEKGANDPPGTNRVDFDITSTFAESPFFEGNISFQGNHYTDVWPLESGIFSVKDFGAHGDGTTEDTLAIQACIDQAIARGPGTAVFFPNGTYVSGNLDVEDATDLRIYGDEATLQWTGVVATGRIGLRLLGTCTRVKIDHLNMVGDGVVASRHAGVYSSSGSFLESCVVSDCAISETTLGISFDMTSGGSYARNCVIERNRIEHVVGTNSGFGYGIHFADASGEAAGHKVLFNEIHRCQRHGIYMALGRGVVVHGNSIYDHRDELDDGAVRFAMNLARTQFFIVTNNQIIRSHNCSVGIAADAGGICEHVVFANNEIIDPVSLALPVPMMEVGLDIDTDGQANDVLIQGNKFVMNGITSIDILRLNWGRRIVVRNNSFEATTANASTYGISLRGIGETAGTTTFSDDWTIQDNTFRIVDGGSLPTGAAIRMSSPFVDSGIRVTLGGSHGGGRNRYVAAAEASLASALTNPNVFSYENTQLSWSSATGPGSNPTRAANSTTEVVTDTTGLRLENTVATSLSFLTGGFEGQEVTLYGANGNTTLINNAGANGMRLAQSANYLLPVAGIVTLKLIRGQWREVSRSEQIPAFFNVRDFGAAGNGSTNDQPAIQAAISAATTAGGGTVYFPPGTYQLTSRIQRPTGVTLRGAGVPATTVRGASLADAVIGVADPSFAASPIYRAGGVEEMLISNTSEAAAGGIGIDFAKCFDAVIRNVTIEHVETGIWLRNSAYWNHLENVRVAVVDIGVLVTDNANENTLQACHVLSCEVGYRVVATANGGVSNTMFNHCAVEGFLTGDELGYDIDSSFLANAVDNTTIISPRLERNVVGGTGMRIVGTARATSLINPFYVNITTQTSGTLADTLVIFRAALTCAAITPSGNISLLVPGQNIFLGDGTTAGNVGIESRKADTQNISYATWRLGTAAAGLRRLEQWDTSENWNTFLANGSGTLDTFTTIQLDYTNRLVRHRRPITYTLGTTVTNSAFGLVGMGAASGVAMSGAVTQKDPRGQFTLTIGATPSANPTVTFTFVDGALAVIPQALVLRNGGSGVLAHTWTTTTTTLVITLVGTPTELETYIFEWRLTG